MLNEKQVRGIRANRNKTGAFDCADEDAMFDTALQLFAQRRSLNEVVRGLRADIVALNEELSQVRRALYEAQKAEAEAPS